MLKSARLEDVSLDLLDVGSGQKRTVPFRRADFFESKEQLTLVWTAFEARVR